MNEIVTGQNKYSMPMDDVLVFESNQQEHVIRLHEVLKKIESAGLSLKKEKHEFSKGYNH